MAKHTKARILHVDDNQDTRLLMAAVLGDAQYGVMTAGTVSEALQLAREIEFDLFILDIRLEDGTGIELCEKLRELQPDVGVLYYSAYASDQEQQKALAVCGDSYLRKPVGIDDLEEAVASLLIKKGIIISPAEEQPK
ncbi:MAG: two-component system, OmpR family, response regulator [Verrucomicrobiota bacterium]|jgi:CheY-like chemotaxis protein